MALQSTGKRQGRDMAFGVSARRRGEHEARFVVILAGLLQDFQCKGRQRDTVRPPFFHALGRQAPPIFLDLIPRQTGDFPGPLSCHQDKLQCQLRGRVAVQLVQAMLAESYAELLAGRELVLGAAKRFDSCELRLACSQCSCFVDNDGIDFFHAL